MRLVSKDKAQKWFNITRLAENGATFDEIIKAENK